MESLKPPKKRLFKARDKWTFSREIIQDKTRFFALFQYKGGKYFQLREIDYKTGRII
jgi:hypothetical protein